MSQHSRVTLKSGSTSSHRCSTFVLASQTSHSTPWTLPQKLNHWFYTQNLWLQPEIAFRSEDSDSQMNIQCHTLGLNSDAWPTSFNGFISSEAKNNVSVCVEFEFFSALLKIPKLSQAQDPDTAHSFVGRVVL